MPITQDRLEALTKITRNCIKQGQESRENNFDKIQTILDSIRELNKNFDRGSELDLKLNKIFDEIYLLGLKIQSTKSISQEDLTTLIQEEERQRYSESKNRSRVQRNQIQKKNKILNIGSTDLARDKSKSIFGLDKNFSHREALDQDLIGFEQTLNNVIAGEVMTTDEKLRFNLVEDNVDYYIGKMDKKEIIKPFRQIGFLLNSLDFNAEAHFIAEFMPWKWIDHDQAGLPLNRDNPKAKAEAVKIAQALLEPFARLKIEASLELSAERTK